MSGCMAHQLVDGLLTIDIRGTYPPTSRAGARVCRRRGLPAARAAVISVHDGV